MDPQISVITLGVADMARAIRFYRDGLSFPTDAADDAEIAFFMTAGTRLALYPRHLLAEDISPGLQAAAPGFGGITLAHNVRTKEDVPALLQQAARAGGRIVKPAQEVSWGGFSGYFADLDGYFWEVVWNPKATFDSAGLPIFGGA